MGVVNYASITATQLEEVEKSLPVLFDRDDKFFAKIEKKNVRPVSNKAMRITLEISPGGYFGHYDPDGGDLGRGAGSKFDEATISTVHFRHAMEWTHKADIATDTGRKAVVSAFKKIVANAMPDFRRHVNAMCMTDGTGVLGTITSVSTGASVDTYTLTTDGFGAKLLRKGQKVGVYAAGLGSKRVPAAGAGDVEITYLDIPNKTIKVAEVTAAAAGDLLVVAGLTATPPVSLYGVPYHHSIATAGTWLGMTRSTTPEIQCNAVNAAGEFNLSHARLARNKIGDRLGADSIPKLIAMMHPCQKQAYEEVGQFVSMIQKTSADQGLNMYFGDAMQLAGSPVQDDYSWDKTRIDFVNLSVWGRAEMEAVKFYTDANGNRFFSARSTDGGVAAANMFYIVTSFNLFNVNPAAGAYVYGLSVPSGY
jgi:hypothetical protein